MHSESRYSRSVFVFYSFNLLKFQCNSVLLAASVDFTEHPGPGKERSAPAPAKLCSTYCSTWLYNIRAGDADAVRWISSFPCKSFLSFGSFYFCLAFSEVSPC